MATKNYIKTVKTGHWRQARTKAYGEKAYAAYMNISNKHKRST